MNLLLEDGRGVGGGEGRSELSTVSLTVIKTNEHLYDLGMDIIDKSTMEI